MMKTTFFAFMDWTPAARIVTRAGCGIAAGLLVLPHPAGLDRLGPCRYLVCEEFLQIFGRPAVGCDQIGVDLFHLFLGRRSVHRRERGVIELADDRRQRDLAQRERAPVRYFEVV